MAKEHSEEWIRRGELQRHAATVRWAKPGERERFSATMKAAHAAARRARKKAEQEGKKK
jgi:hypothetical protein